MAFWQNKPNLTTPISATNLNNLAGGWTKITETLTYASADSPTFVINTSADTTSYLSVGMKIKLTQATVKYFIITAITSTTITVYGGTDYTLANATITDAFFSVHRAPFGFPMNPAKWTVTVVDTTQRAQANPVQNTWYNLGGVSISVPIGLWEMNYSLLPYSYRVGSTSKIQTDITLSTTTNSVTDASMSSAQYVGLLAATAELALSLSIKRPLPLAITTKTTYYLLTRTIVASTTNLSNENAIQNLYITAVCAYL